MDVSVFFGRARRRVPQHLADQKKAIAAGHRAMTIGIEQFRDPVELRLGRMLTQPFRGDVGAYPIGRRPIAG